MPQSTVAGARWPQSIVPFQQEESVNNSPSPKKKKNLTDPIKTLEDYRAGMMQARDDLPKNSRIGGYKAHLIENEATGERELTITVQALKVSLLYTVPYVICESKPFFCLKRYCTNCSFINNFPILLMTR